MSDQSMHDSCITLKHKEKQEPRLLHGTNLDESLSSRKLIEEQEDFHWHSISSIRFSSLVALTFRGALAVVCPEKPKVSGLTS